jgi:pSer/pThr/pTyr-binding forkhead associated (FHA) protein
LWRISALDREGKEIAACELATGEISIGRETDRQIVLPSASVSRKHARIMINGGQPVIVDDGSSNGVHVDGVRIAAPTAIGPMSRIDLAEFRITVAPLGGAQAARQPNAPGPSPMGIDAIRLVADGGPYDGRVFDVPAGQVTVGRALDNELVFDDPSLSRKHCRVSRQGPGQLALEDLGSSNGSYVNGRKIGRAVAATGDVVQFGDLVFRVEGEEMSGTRAVDAGGGGQSMALAVGGALTGLIVVGAIVSLFHKVPPVQASGKDAIARITANSEQHLQEGKARYREKKYAEAKLELDQALEIDPANLEARRLSRLAAKGPEDDRAYKSAEVPLAIADRKGIEQALRWFDDMSEGSPQKTHLANKVVASLERFASDRCAKRQWLDCAWGACKAYEVAPPDSPPDARAQRTLADAEKHLARDKNYTRCRFAR